MNYYEESLKTFHESSEQKEIPINFFEKLLVYFLEIHGTIKSFKDLLANIAPASIILEML